MRMFLTEGDLVLAEVQQISSMDQSISVHIRNEKFGKLKNGFLVKVGSDLIKKQARHMVDLSMGVKLILGMNGWIWLEPMNPDDVSAIEKMAKLANILRLLGDLYVGIRIDLLLNLYNFCQDHSPNEIIHG